MALIIVWAKLAKRTGEIQKFLNLSNRMRRMTTRNTHPVAETMIKAVFLNKLHSIKSKIQQLT